MIREGILTVEQISKILHVRANVIRKPYWRFKTHIPLKKINGRLAIYEKDFMDWLKPKRTKPTEGIDNDTSMV